MMLQRSCLRISLLASALFGTAAFAPSVAHAATLTVVNNDGPGEGFNDPTPRTPVGGNTGTTVGAQRLIAFQRAAGIWGGLLSSSVSIRIGATFDALPCAATLAVLGSAGPAGAVRDFAGAPVANTWYHNALANALHGSALDPAVDIVAQFNSTFGTTCPFPKGWYYGLDGNAGNDSDFVTIVLHELAHGLGFTTFVNLTSGQKLLGFNDTFMLNLEHHGGSPADYPSMSNAQRVAASTDTGNLHWVGAHVRAVGDILTAGGVDDHVRMFAPKPGQPGSSVAHWDTALNPNQLMEPAYTGPNHTPVLELSLFQDIGWSVAPSALSAFVSGFYQDVLGRQSEPVGLASWIGFLQANCNAAGFNNLGVAFFDSPEFRTVHPLTLNGLVTALYRAFLDRDPDPGGLAVWVQQFRTARVNLANGGFISSAEFRNLLPNRADRTAVQAVVTRFYTDILGRSPEPGGLNAWVNHIVATGDLEGAAIAFITAAEFESRPLSSRDYVTVLYRAFLRREPDVQGLDGWENVLRNHLIGIIQEGFVPSGEFQSKAPQLCGS